MNEFERNGTTEYDEMGFQNRFKNETFCFINRTKWHIHKSQLDTLVCICAKEAGNQLLVGITQILLALVENALRCQHGGSMQGCQGNFDCQRSLGHLQIWRDYFFVLLVYDDWFFHRKYRMRHFIFAKLWMLFLIMILILCNTGMCVGTWAFQRSKNALLLWKCWHMVL